MLVISSREFRSKQAEYMDRVDNGEQIIVQRGKDKAYKITPVVDDDLYFTPEMILKLKSALAQAEEGKTVAISSKEELHDFLDKL